MAKENHTGKLDVIGVEKNNPAKGVAMNILNNNIICPKAKFICKESSDALGWRSWGNPSIVRQQLGSMKQEGPGSLNTPVVGVSAVKKTLISYSRKRLELKFPWALLVFRSCSLEVW